MKGYIRLRFLLIVSCFGFSCCGWSDYHNTKVLLKDMLESTVSIPKRVTCIQGGKVFPMPESIRNQPKLVVFVDSTECSRCRIDKLVHYSEMFTLSEETNAFKVMILLSTPKSEYNDIYEHLLYSESQYPVYMDDDNAFRRINPSIPDKSMFHTMIVNENNEIVLVGDPVHNERVMELFNRAFQIK